jgi:transposase
MFEELNDEEWARIGPLAADEPVHPHRRGRPRAETRVVANAVLWILTTGERWSKLPARYPSGPTCRRRFDEWLADGTLIEMVNVLSDSGRAFTYVPQPQPVVPAEPKCVPAPESPRLRGVFWTNPESWQEAGSCTYRAGDLPVESPRALRSSNDALSAMRELGHAAPAFNAAAPIHKRTDDYCGYTIHATAQPVTRQMRLSYRASAEIARHGKRVERSGLIGPCFTDYESAERHALEWARDWIDRHTSAAAVAAAASNPGVAAVPTKGEADAAPPLPAAIASRAPSAARKLDPVVTRDPSDWMRRYPDGRDAKPPELVYLA